jgi:hypothetical protein
MKRVLLVMLACLLLGGVSEAVQTKVVVRAKARDAKFIGSTMAGALVVVKDAETGEILAKGFTTGGTGNTERIMVEPRKRGVPIADASSAGFETSIDISEPKLVTIEIFSPYGQRQSMTENSVQTWLIPGKNITGDGIIVEVYGFSVDVLSPQAHQMVKLSGNKLNIPVQANVVMMCGCPVKPGGLWDASRYDIEAIVKRNGKVVGTHPMSFAGKPNTFETNLDIVEDGTYEVTVFAFDPATGNAGIDRTSFMVTK